MKIESLKQLISEELAKATNEGKKPISEKLDPVGKEDDDIDNDGDVDKTDKYLLNRRKAIKKASEEKDVKEAYADLSPEERLKVGKEYDHETIAQAYLNKMGRDSNLKSDDLLKIGKKVVFLNYDGDLGAAYKDLVKEASNNPYYNAIEAKAKKMGMTANDFMKDLLAKEFEKFKKEKGVTDKTIKVAKKDFDAKIGQMGFQDLAKLAGVNLEEAKGETDEKRLDDLLDIILKYVEDPDNAEEELQNYIDSGYPGFSDMLKANLDRDLDFQTWVQVGYDRGLEEGHTDIENEKLKVISKELKSASKLHKGQAKKLDKITNESVNEARGFTTKELRLKATEILRSLGIQIDDSTIMDMVKTLMDTINKNTAGVVLTNEAHDCATTHPDMSHEEYETSLNEDMDLGHEDNEPHMIKADLYRIGKYSMDLYKMVNKFDQDDVEVDFPSWWQSKIFKAKDALVGAKHYLDFELKEPEIDAMVDVASEEEIIDEEFVNITPNEESGEAVEAESDGPGY